MCDIVKTDALLAYLLNRKERITFSELRSLRDKIIKENPDIIVDISGPSVERALYYYPQLFHQDDSSIVRTKEAELFFSTDYLQNIFFSSFSKRVAQTLAKVIV